MGARFEKFIFPAVFLVYLAMGVWVHADYGVSWDETISRTNGLVNLKYVEQRMAPSLLDDDVRKAPDLATWSDRDYGVAFELPLVALEQMLSVKDEDIYSFRHLLTFLFSALGVLALYKTVTLVYRDRRLGLVAALMLILMPRFFAESFYNSKDMVFMASVAIATYTLTRLILEPRFRWAVLHGFACAFAIDVRIMGVMVVAGTLVLLVVRGCKKEMEWRRIILVLAVFVATVATFVIAMFPFLWDDPVGNFELAFKNMASFRWSNWVLYRGMVYQASELPWHYLPVWILISTPILTIALMAIGVARAIRILVANRLGLWRSNTQMAHLAYVALFLGPLTAVIIIHAVVYDGWRHLYFVYPACILVAVGGLDWVWRKLAGRPVARHSLAMLIAFSFVANAAWIARAHPLQNVYFNILAGRDRADNYDVDYWGLGNRAAFEAILRSTTSKSITIKAISMTPLDRALLSIPMKDRSRFLLSPGASRTEYVLTNYRLESRCEGICDLRDYRLFYRKKVAGESVVSVFKLKDGQTPDVLTASDRPYTADELRALSYRLERVDLPNGRKCVDVIITNHGATTISALSRVGEPIRLSWRFLGKDGVPLFGWDHRAALPRDIPAAGQTTVRISIDETGAVDGGSLQVSAVQEGAFWLHDIGVPPATVAWPR